jgi:hypothetical protein
MSFLRRAALSAAVVIGSVFLFLILYFFSDFFPEIFTHAQVSSTISEELAAEVPTSTDPVPDNSVVSTTLDSPAPTSTAETLSKTENIPTEEPLQSSSQSKNSGFSQNNFQSENNFGGSLAINEVVVATSSGGEAISSLDLNENSTKTIFVHGSYYHPNGCASVAQGSFALKVFRSGIGESCYINDSNCYGTYSEGYNCNYSTVAQDQCELGNPSDLTASFECSVPLYYFAEPTDTGVYGGENWRALISITDTSYTSVQSFSSFTMNTLSALDVSPILEYGEMGIGGISNPVSMTITNTGNKSGVNPRVSGTSLTCASGEIPVSSQYYSTAYPYYIQSMSQLTTSSTTVLLGLNRTTSKKLSFHSSVVLANASSCFRSGRCM